MEFLTERLQFLDLTDANETEQSLIEKLLFTSKEPLQVPWCTSEIKRPEDDRFGEKWKLTKNGKTDKPECSRTSNFDGKGTFSKDSKADKNNMKSECKSKKDNKQYESVRDHTLEKRSPQAEKVFPCPPNSVSHIQMYPIVPSLPGVFVPGVHPSYVPPVTPRYGHNLTLGPSQRRPSPKAQGTFSRDGPDPEGLSVHQRQCVERKCDYSDAGNVENYGPPSYRTIQPIQPYYLGGAPANPLYVQPAVLPVYSPHLFNPYGQPPASLVYRQPEASPCDYSEVSERNCGPCSDNVTNKDGEQTGETSCQLVCETLERSERVKSSIGDDILSDASVALETINNFNETVEPSRSNRSNPEPIDNEKVPKEPENSIQCKNVESCLLPGNNDQVAKSNAQKHEHLCYHTEVVVKLPKKKSTYSSQIHVSSAVKKINVSGSLSFSNFTSQNVDGVDSRNANINRSRSINNDTGLSENERDNTGPRDASDNPSDCAIRNCNIANDNGCCDNNKDDCNIRNDEHSFIIKNKSNNSNNSSSSSSSNNNNNNTLCSGDNDDVSCINRNNNNSSSHNNNNNNNNNHNNHHHHHHHHLHHHHHHNRQNRNRNNGNNNDNDNECLNDCIEEDCGMLKTANVIIEISSGGRHNVKSGEILGSNGPCELIPSTKCSDKTLAPTSGKSWASLFNSSMSDGKGRPLARVSPHLKEGFKEIRDSKPNVSSTEGDLNFSSATASENKLLEDLDLRQLGEFLSSYSPDHRIISLQPRGLTNRNNWCYVNAILQSLIACPPFYNLLKAMPAIPKRKRSSETLIIDNLADFVNEFGPLPAAARIGKREKSARNKEENTVEVVPGPAFEPSGIYKILDKVRGESSFNIEGRQEDAEEFLSCLLNGLSDEMFELMKVVDSKESKVSKEDHCGHANGNGEDEAEWNVIGPKNKSSVTRRAVCGRTPIADIFRGQLRSRVQRAGDQSTDNVQPFFTLQLDIEKAASVKEALELLVGKDQLEGVTCSKTHREVEAWTQTTLEDLPVVLILHLKCFDYKPDGCSKIIKNVDFPIDLKIDAKLMSVNRNKYTSKQRNYKLVAVVYHDGKEASKGHYVTDAYHVGYGCWIRYDDGAVRSVPESYVLKPRAPRMPYLLYYRRGDTVSAVK